MTISQSPIRGNAPLGSRIVQRKMSMKVANRPGRFPMQDEHEKGKNGVGVARSGADTDAKCREPEPGSDPTVFTVQRADRVRQQRAGRTIPVGGASIGGAEVPGVRKGRAGIGAGLSAESDGVERGAEHAVDPGVSGSRRRTRPAVPTAHVSQPGTRPKTLRYWRKWIGHMGD